MIDYNKPFPKRLRKLLAEKNISQQKLADAVGVSQQAIAKWTSGQSEPNMTYFKNIAEFFGVSYEYLYGDSKSQKRENLLIADELGLSDGVIEKLRKWAKDFPANDKNDNEDLNEAENVSVLNEVITLPAILSYMLEHDGFALYLERFQKCLYERIAFLKYEQETYEELANIENSGFEIYDDEEAEYYARQVGKRLINAGDLSHFYRKLAVEALEVVMNDLHDEYAGMYADSIDSVSFGEED